MNVLWRLTKIDVFLPTHARHKSVTRSLQTWHDCLLGMFGRSPGLQELLVVELFQAFLCICWKISGAVSSELTVELLRNRLPQELLLIAKTGSSSDARTGGCPATGPGSRIMQQNSPTKPPLGDANQAD